MTDLRAPNNFERVWNARVEDDAVWAPDADAASREFSPLGPPTRPAAAVTPPAAPVESAPAAGWRTHRLLVTGLALFVIAALGGAAFAAAQRSPADAPTAAAPIPTVTIPPRVLSPPPTGVPSTNDNAPAAAANARRGVVEITSTLAFGRGQGAGTGMLITPDGDVLTNNHVVEGAGSIAVQVNGTGRTYKATVVGTDAAHDVALIHMENASGLTPVQTSDSSTLKLGDAVTAVGNALGLPGPPSVVTGVVTALAQDITAGDRGTDNGEALAGMIQTDVPLQPGDSGGPLIDVNSKVVGMNTATSSGRRRALSGQESFAIPIEDAVAIAREIEAGRSSATIRIGVPAFLGIGMEAAPGGGAAVIGVEDGTPAAAAGIVAGDTIVSFDGKPVADPAGLRSLIQARKPGDRVPVGWTNSAGQRRSAVVTLAAGPPA